MSMKNSDVISGNVSESDSITAEMGQMEIGSRVRPQMRQTHLSGTEEPQQRQMRKVVSNNSSRGHRFLADIQKTLNTSLNTSMSSPLRSRCESQSSDLSLSGVSSSDTRFSGRIECRTPNLELSIESDTVSPVPNHLQYAKQNNRQQYRQPKTQQNNVRGHRQPTYKIEDIDKRIEILDSVEKVIGQFADMSQRADRSAAQIKRNIMASSFVACGMTEEDWQLVVDYMIKLAIEGGESDFVMDMMPVFMQYGSFCTVMCDTLMMVCTRHILYGDERPVPEFIGSILCGNWPRNLAKAIEAVNPVLFVTMTIIKGWIVVLTEDNNQFIQSHSSAGRLAKEPLNSVSGTGGRVEAQLARRESGQEIAHDQRANNSFAENQQHSAVGSRPSSRSSSNSHVQQVDEKPDLDSSISTLEDDSEEEQKTTPEDIAMVNRICMAIYVLCERAQRSLWLKWPELCDEIYEVIRPAITHNKNVEPEAKSALLYTYTQMLKWTGPKPVTRNSTTQTCE